MAALNSCCCGFNLRPGTLIIGYLSLVYALCTIVLRALGWSIDNIINRGSINLDIGTPHDSDVELKVVTQPVLNVDNVLAAVNLMLAVSLVVMVHMDIKKELKWWVYINACVSCFTLFYYAFGGPWAFIKSFFGFFIDIYGMLVVHSYSVQEEDETSTVHKMDV